MQICVFVSDHTPKWGLDLGVGISRTHRAIRESAYEYFTEGTVIINTKGDMGDPYLIIRNSEQREAYKASDPLESRWSPPPMDTHNPQGATSTLLASSIEIEYLIKGERAERGGNGPMKVE
ncbi:hypothetical protein EVAR_46023_1 [Eumeta japonica]|uniref:Uncharacterized protein n=1 Tax=Eumeta variegata TaxID=151549 RepID=A0A4C1Z569_EUMVA|nr:hypothetical protein EVAR_46023_1 [Eumeta japonica]